MVILSGLDGSPVPPAAELAEQFTMGAVQQRRAVMGTGNRWRIQLLLTQLGSCLVDAQQAVPGSGRPEGSGGST